MEHTQQGTVECGIKGSKILNLALSSLAFFVLTILFPVSSTPFGRILTYVVWSFGGMGIVAVLCVLHLKYVRQTPWVVVTKNALKWFLPMKMDYASLDFASVERFRAVKTLGIVVVYAYCRDGRKIATGIDTAFLSSREVYDLVQEMTARLREFNSVE